MQLIHVLFEARRGAQRTRPINIHYIQNPQIYWSRIMRVCDLCVTSGSSPGYCKITTCELSQRNISRNINHLIHLTGIGVVVSTTAFHARFWGSVPGLGGLKETKNVSSPFSFEIQYCGEPPWPRGSVHGLRRPELEFQILCLEDSVISIISPSSGGSPGPL